MLRPIVLAGVFAALALAGCSPESNPLVASLAAGSAQTEQQEATGRGPDDPPNVLLIVVDTLRADHLSHYGYDRNTAGPLDALRNRSTLFENAYATAPWTGPSTMSILSGLSTVRHGANAHGDRFPDEVMTLAEYLSDAGYATHGISFNPNVSAKTGFDRGFDTFDDSDTTSTGYPDIRVMTRKVNEWANDPPGRPFFLYLHPMNVHGPYRAAADRRSALLGRPPSYEFRYYGPDLMTPLMRDRDRSRDRSELRARVTPSMLQSLIDQYDVAVRYSMEQIAIMTMLLERQGLLDNTIVILTSDHGEELFDHGGFSHGYTLYREVLQVPLYLHVPGQAGPATSERLVSTVDIVPTILELTGTSEPDGLDGYSLLAPDEEVPGDRVIVQQTAWKRRSEGLSAIQGSSHLIDLIQNYDTPDPKVSLYDLETDPREQHDLAGAHEARTASLHSRLERRLAQLAREEHLAQPENVLSEMDTERLRALGYIE